MRIVFFGTPEFAATCLGAVLRVKDRHPIVRVYTQPDRPVGRSGQPQPPPVKRVATSAGLAVEQPESIRDPEFARQVAATGAELGVVVAYGKILPPALLAALPRGFVNVHASLLPRWRGASPIQAAIQAGDATSGVTTMQMDAGLDTGDMLLWEEIALDARETAGSLHDRLASLGTDLIVRTLDGLESGTLAATPQSLSPNGPASVCRTMKKDDGKIDWRVSASAIERMVRALNPWPGAVCQSTAGERILLREVAASDSKPAGLDNASPGSAVAIAGQIHVACGSGSIEIITLQRAGKRAVSASEFLRGLRATSELGFA